LEATRNVDIVTPPENNILGIAMVGKLNSPTIPPTRPGAIVPTKNITDRFSDFEYDSNILQYFGTETFHNYELAKKLVDMQKTLIQKIVPTTQMLEYISKRPTK
jgi:hypothetical protein